MITFTRSEGGYGWSVDFGKRVRWNSTKATTPMLWRFIKGADENCNRALTLTMWPIGMLDVWYEPHWRTDEIGICEDCKKFYDEYSLCRACGSKPCHCAWIESEQSA